MKKLIIILAAALSINAASAQSRNAVYNDRDQYRGTQQTVNNHYNDGWNGNQAYNNNQGNDQYGNRVAYGQSNGRYDQRNNEYGYDRSVNGYERQRRMNDIEAQRQQKKSLGTGLIVGGIAAVLIGALISH